MLRPSVQEKAIAVPSPSFDCVKISFELQEHSLDIQPLSDEVRRRCRRLEAMLPQAGGGADS